MLTRQKRIFIILIIIAVSVICFSAEDYPKFPPYEEGEIIDMWHSDESQDQPTLTYFRYGIKRTIPVKIIIKTVCTQKSGYVMLIEDKGGIPPGDYPTWKEKITYEVSIKPIFPGNYDGWMTGVWTHSKNAEEKFLIYEFDPRQRKQMNFYGERRK